MMLDTLTLANRLTEAGVEQKHANAIAYAIHDAQGETIRKTDLEHFATKADLYPAILLQTAVILGSTFAMLRLLLS